MRLKVNGEEQELPDGATVAALLDSLGVRADRVAVERNRLVVRRGTFAETRLEAGDEVEILTFVGGG
jgi:thiamine biosynthesis protein ThiS